MFALALAALSQMPAAVSGMPISRNVQLLAHFNNFTRYSACTAYVHPDGREYAVLGTETGTSIVNVTNPSASYEVAFIPGLSSWWREMKQYRTWLYVSTEAIGGGIQIIRMTDPEHPVLVSTYAAAFNREHTVTVDTTRALLILNGTRATSTMTGMHLLSLANPEAPVDLGFYNGDYIHDSWMRGTRLHAFCISSDTVRIFDTSNPAAPVQQAFWTYPGAKPHSGETSKDGRYLFVCDEVNYATLKVFDIQNLAAHPMLWESTVNPISIPHNVHVSQDTAFVSWYTEGVRLFDITDPTLPAQWGWYDTYPSYSGGFHGVWELACGFPSGTFIASDIESGLYVFRANHDYGVVKVRARDSGGTPMSDVDVVHVESPDDSTRTGTSGGARIAVAPGAATIRLSRFGYATAFVTDNVSVGSQDSFVVTMNRLPSTTISGTIRRAGDAALVPEATIEVEGTPLSGTSVLTGAFSIPGAPAGIYSVRAYRSGFAPAARVTAVEPGVTRSIDFKLLTAAWYDSCDTDRGWSLADPTDNAVTGRWVRVVPNGTTGQNAAALPRSWDALAVPRLPREPLRDHDGPQEGLLSEGPVAPGADATPGPGSGYCFVTENGPAGGAPSANDVDGGKTTLTTPPLDLTGMTEPTLSWQRWYHMNTPGEPDSFVIQITRDGTTWVTVRSMIESHPEWHEDVIRVKDYIVPSATVRVRFIAQDEPPTDGVVEAGVDDFMAYDAALKPANVEDTTATSPGSPAVVLGAPRPNPATREASFTLRLRAAGHARVSVFDASGRRVASLLDGEVPAGVLTLRWNGRDARVRAASSGIYWIRAEAAGERLTRRMVWVR